MSDFRSSVPAQVMEALFSGESAVVYVHKDGNEYRARLDNKRRVSLTCMNNYTALTEVSHYFLGKCKDTMRSMYRQNKGGAEADKGPGAKKAVRPKPPYVPSVPKTRELLLFLKEKGYGEYQILHDGILVDEVKDLLQADPKLSNVYKAEGELRKAITDLRTGLKKSRKGR